VKKIILCLALFFLCTLATGQQKYTMPRERKDAEAILNAITNSVMFDSINTVYSIREPVFLKNGLLFNDSFLVLTYNGQKIKITDSLFSYPKWSLFKLFVNPIENPKDAVVRIALILKRLETVIEITLKKSEKEKWEINKQKCLMPQDKKDGISSDEYNKEAEAILNAITNSVMFDSINTVYSIREPVFINDEYSFLASTYKGKKIKILNVDSLTDNIKYWSLAHFFLNPYFKNHKNAAVDAIVILSLEEGKKYNSIEEVSIKITLKKSEKGKWEIKDFFL
jgi:hypothetical protein